MTSRRHVLAAGGALAASALMGGCTQPAPAGKAVNSARKRIAVTMDDFDLRFDKMLSPKARNAAILAAFSAHDHRAAGFVTGALAIGEDQIEDDARQNFAREIISSWSQAGHLLGNHTWSHKNSSDEDSSFIQADILKNHEYLTAFPGYEKIFRFPFLAEGGGIEKIETYREFLAAQGFQNAPVTISSIDWFISLRLEQRIMDSPSFVLSDKDYAAYRDYYIQLVLEVSNQKDDLARRLGYNDLPHSLLMHHNVLNGLYLKEVMDALAADGWEFVDAREMFSHPLYSLKPKTPTRGRSVLSVLAQEAGIAHNFPEKYYGFGKAEMERLGL